MAYALIWSAEDLDAAADDDIYELADAFGCSSSQIAGVKAALAR